MSGSAARPLLLLSALALLSAACETGTDAKVEAAGRAGQDTSTTVDWDLPESYVVETTAPPTTAAPKSAAPAGMGQGARGPEVLALEQKLADLRYDVGKVDGVYDANTFHAVMAFQKVNGLSRTGRATDDVRAKVGAAGLPGPLVPGGGSTKVEVDIKRQVLFLWKDGGLYRILSVSTGNGKRYCVDGDCATAVTPGGSFRVTRRINGWRTSRLGRLYNPLYFNGGIAIHGSPSVPAYPASHGCVRITMAAAGWFPSAVPNGTPVYVVGGPRAPVPFNEPAPDDTRPDPPPTTEAPPPTSAPTTAPPTSAPVVTVAPTTTTTAPAGSPPPPPTP